MISIKHSVIKYLMPGTYDAIKMDERKACVKAVEDEAILCPEDTDDDIYNLAISHALYALEMRSNEDKK